MNTVTGPQPQSTPTPRASEPEATAFLVGLLSGALRRHGFTVLHADPSGFLILTWDGKQRHVGLTCTDCE